MINSACERIKELESELLEKDISYKAMMEQRDALASACVDALHWVECDTYCYGSSLNGDDSYEFYDSIEKLEKILKEHLK